MFYYVTLLLTKRFRKRNSWTSSEIGTPEMYRRPNNKKAVLSQRRPRDAPYISLL